MDPHDLPSIKSEPLRFTLMTLTPPSLSLITSFLMQILFLYPDCSFLLLVFLTELLPALAPRSLFFPLLSPQLNSFQVQAPASPSSYDSFGVTLEAVTVHRGSQRSLATTKHFTCSVQTITHITQSSLIFLLAGWCVYLYVSVYITVFAGVSVCESQNI